MKPTLVLGIGNVFLSDEAVGVRLIEALEKRFNFSPALEIIDGGTCGLELLDDMANREHIIVADAVLSQKNPPGTILVLQDEKVPVMFTRKISPHQLGLTDVLSALTMTDEFPKKLTLIGIVPKSVEFNQPLSDTVANVFEDALLQIVEIVRKDGYTVTEKTNP